MMSFLVPTIIGAKTMIVVIVPAITASPTSLTPSSVDAQLPLSWELVVLDAQELAAGQAEIELHETAVDPDAVICVDEVVTGGDRPVFDQGFLFWNFFAGDFLFGVLAGTDGTLPRSPGQTFDNIDTVYQFDTDPGLILPGHRTAAGTRQSPSQFVFFSPRKGFHAASGQVFIWGPLSVL